MPIVLELIKNKNNLNVANKRNNYFIVLIYAKKSRTIFKYSLTTACDILVLTT